MAEKRPPLPEPPLPCPFCGSEPRVLWNGGMTIKCMNQECCQPKTGWWYDVAKCVAQWNSRHNGDAVCSFSSATSDTVKGQ